MHKEEVNGEISLFNLTLIVWQEKWKILVITFISVLLGFVYLYFSPKVFFATVEIGQITTIENDRYQDLNNELDHISDGSFKRVTPFLLQELYVDFLNNKEIFTGAFLKRGMQQNDRIVETIGSISLSSSASGSQKLNKTWFIEVEHDNLSELLEKFRHVDFIINSKVRESLNSNFETFVYNLNLKQKGSVRHVNSQIQELFDQYEDKVQRSLTRLSEDLEVARTLELFFEDALKNNISKDNQHLLILHNYLLFYSQSVKVIERKMELMQSRKDKEAFIDNTIKLTTLKERKRLLEKSTNIDLLQDLYEATPLSSGNDFRAAWMKVGETKVRYKAHQVLFIIYSAFIGLIMGLIYILNTRKVNDFQD